MKRKRHKTRNPLALVGLIRNGAGKHCDRKKAANKRKCRGKVRDD